MLGLPDFSQSGNVKDRQTELLQKHKMKCYYPIVYFLQSQTAGHVGLLENSQWLPVLTVSTLIVIYTHWNIRQTHFMGYQKGFNFSNKFENAEH